MAAAVAGPVRPSPTSCHTIRLNLQKKSYTLTLVIQKHQPYTQYNKPNPTQLRNRRCSSYWFPGLALSISCRPQSA